MTLKLLFHSYSTAVKDRIVGFLLFLGKVAIVGVIGKAVYTRNTTLM